MYPCLMDPILFARYSVSLTVGAGAGLAGGTRRPVVLGS